jgi:hypothetical protein
MISLLSFDSIAIIKIFSSLTRNGLNETTVSDEGNVKSYRGVSIVGNAIISPYIFILYI